MESQSTDPRSRFSPFTTWVPGFELALSGLAANTPTERQLANLKAVIFILRLCSWVGIAPEESTNGTSTSGPLCIGTKERPREAGRSRHTGGKLSVCGELPTLSTSECKSAPMGCGGRVPAGVLQKVLKNLPHRGQV